MSLNRRQLIVSSGALLAPAAWAQSRPPIRILVGFPPGGATDAIARAVADRLPALLGQPVIVENKPGVGGRMAADTVLAAPADGLTFMIAPNATPTFQMLVFGHQIRWNILKDFTSVAGIASYPLGMGVALNTKATNAREFVEWVKKNPDKASFGTPGLGGQNAYLGEQFAKTAGIDLPVTPYKGSPPMVNDLLGGHVPAAVSLLDGMMAHHRAGKIRVIGVFTKERSPLMPDIPTFAEQGIDVTSGEAWTGMWAKAGTPAAEVERMQKAVQQALQMPEVKEQLSQRLWANPHFRTGAQLEALQRAELAHWEPLIKASGFKAE
ncbi:MAG: ABC transporter substrate-binding protein [Hydrogenophaga sp.]|jgi:tripartite-type tricarboxylate transporter receptor subunit TctC|uniref:Bug family tripartite tricarboxylate transporter substrate binding protein n=1 Tax=Hydrogenophaga sp. TaxID=1904254 RepID=UPI00260F2561|nr:tripartite tricarboxylate transporter substrate-binding protein [Hydrogenophaga sp.]MCW5670778.1 ABC transporter substrate-binding protein [Hydrogenophaga sp.]